MFPVLPMHKHKTLMWVEIQIYATESKSDFDSEPRVIKA